jgi:hypothetical protein
MDGKKLNAFEESRIRQQKADIESVMSTENGRRFVWRILEYCGVYRDIVGDQNEMLKQIGNRQTGLYIMGLIDDACGDKLFRMMTESKNVSKEEELFYEREDRRLEADRNAGHRGDNDNTDDREFKIPRETGLDFYL